MLKTLLLLFATMLAAEPTGTVSTDNQVTLLKLKNAMNMELINYLSFQVQANAARDKATAASARYQLERERVRKESGVPESCDLIDDQSAWKCQ